MGTEVSARVGAQGVAMALSRRDFVKTAAMTGATLAACKGAPALKQPEPVTVRLGLCSYTFRDFTRARLIGFMKQLHAFDLNAKDAKDHLPIDPPAEQAALADYTANGIRLHAAGAVYFSKDDDADIRSKFDYCRRAGIGVIVAGDPTPQALPQIEKFVQEYDIRIAIHNHGPEDKLWPSPLDILKDIENLDRRIGCCIDVGHTVRAGTDVMQAIHEVGPRLFNIHMKDLTDFHNKESQVAVGEGKMPVRDIFEALIAIRYPGFVDLEYEVHADDPMPGVIASFAYMRGVLAGMGHPASEESA